MWLLNPIRPMKLIDYTIYGEDNLWGYCLDIVKFKSRAVFQLTVDEAAYRDLPSLMIQIGSTDLFYVSVGLVKYIVSFTVWGRHYDD